MTLSVNSWTEIASAVFSSAAAGAEMQSVWGRFKSQDKNRVRSWSCIPYSKRPTINLTTYLPFQSKVERRLGMVQRQNAFCCRQHCRREKPLDLDEAPEHWFRGQLWRPFSIGTVKSKAWEEVCGEDVAEALSLCLLWWALQYLRELGFSSSSFLLFSKTATSCRMRHRSTNLVSFKSTNLASFGACVAGTRAFGARCFFRLSMTLLW